MKPFWLDDLIKNAPYNFKTTKQMMPLYFYQDCYKEDSQLYPDDVIIPSEKVPNKNLILPPTRYVISDLQKHAVKYKIPAIDFILQLPRFNNSVLIADNQLLQFLGAKYHVVVLNATADFVLRHFPRVTQKLAIEQVPTRDTLEFEHTADTIKTAPQKTLNQLFKPVTQCLCFLDQQNRCFLALPCFYQQKANLGKHLPVIETDLMTISHILQHMPLIKINGVYPLRLYVDKVNQKIHQIRSMTYYPDYEFYAIYNVLDLDHINDKIRRNLTPTALAQLARGEHYNTLVGTFNNIVYHLPARRNNPLDLVLKYHSDFFLDQLGIIYQALLQDTKRFLTSNLLVTSKKQGKIAITLKAPYAKWQTALAHAMKTAKPAVWRYYLHQVIVKQNIKQVTFKFQQTTVKPLALKQQIITKPLADSKGLNQVNLRMQPNTNHQYYAVKDKLITFAGKKQITKISEVKL